LNVEERYVREEFQRVKSRPQGGRPKSPAAAGTGQKPGRRPLDEVYIIQLLLQLPEKITEVCRDLSVEDFDDATTRSIFQKIKTGARDLHALLSASEGEEKNLLTKISVEAAFEDPHRVLSDCVKRLGEKKRKAMIKDLDRRIRDAETKKDAKLLTRLLTERNNLIR